MSTKKLIVGYRTRIVSEEVFEQLMPTITASKTIKEDNHEKIKEDIEKRVAAFRANAHTLPYMATFDEVCIISPSTEEKSSWKCEGRDPYGSKLAMCLAIRGWLLKRFPNAWPEDTHEVKKPEVVFIGFNPRLFVKMLGLECSLPQYNKPLPPKLWYSSSDYRDIESAVLPDDCKPLTLPAILKRRRPPDPDAGAKWDEMLKNWTEPGKDPAVDAWLATELATQLGFLLEDTEE